MIYRPEIDGLRAIAVLAVIFNHAGVAWVPGGFLGVDIFFVISGFLITSIILHEKSRDNFSIQSFYERRARRILPALFTMIALVTPFAWAWMVPYQFSEYAESIVASILFVSNIFFWRSSGYFDPSAEEKPLLHTWSLAVEEQYYIFFPVLVILMWPMGRRLIFWGILAVSVMSLMLSEFASTRYAQASFYLAPTRIWEIGLGSLIAFMPPPRSAAMKDHAALSSQILAGIGLLAILGPLFLFDETVRTPSLMTLIPVSGTALVLRYGHAATVVARILALWPLVSIGLVSYSAYLWHQPILALARIRFQDTDATLPIAMMIALTFAAAFLSYQLIERPFRRRGAKAISLRTLVRTLGATAVMITSFSIFAQVEIALGHYRLTPFEHANALQPFEEMAMNREALRLDPSSGAHASSFPADTNSIRMLIVGDSHTTDLFNIVYMNRVLPDDITFRIMPLFDGCMGLEKGQDPYAHTRSCIAQYLTEKTCGTG